nr:immunoglobulin heavy chain junction region [Macaca mulatta]MOW80400.1 immunoglobulin heavy chain junction region [Macaca mulatta]
CAKEDVTWADFDSW